MSAQHARVDDKQRALEREIVQLERDREVLDSQIKELIRSEHRLGDARMQYERQLRRIEALNTFALAASGTTNSAEIFDLGLGLLFSLYPFEQGAAFALHPDGYLRPFRVRALAGCEENSAQRLAQCDERDEVYAEAPPRDPLLVADAQIAEAPPFTRRLVETTRELYTPRARGGEGLAGDSAAQRARAAAGADTAGGLSLCLPLVGRGESAFGAIVLHTPEAGRISPHEQFPQSADTPFVRLTAAHVAAAVQSARLYEQVRDMAEINKAYASKVVDAQEQERSRVARELHDGIAQQLVAMRMDAEWVAVHLDDEPAARPVAEQLTMRLAQAIVAIRNIVYDLRPPLLDDFGVASAIKAYAAQISDRAPVRCDVEIVDDPEKLPSAVATALYRIAQEGINNAVRHSGAALVRVTLEDSGNVVLLRVRDDGSGMSSARINAPTSMGLIGMRERASLLGGELLIKARPGNGTLITVAIPYKPS